MVRKEFAVFYQPLVNLCSRRVVGVEALLRWRHPERGLVLPTEFVPLVEELGLIVPLGEWILRTACAGARDLPGRPALSVNLSAVQFSSDDIVQAVAEALRASGLEAQRLELEITETVLLRSTETVLKTLHRLKALGVRIVMDDFGTGYSSLSYLQLFPFDKVKIDQRFIRDLASVRGSMIVRAIAGLCAGLDLPMIAEGVETDAQLQVLIANGCTAAQGYLFSEAVPGEAIQNVLRRLNAGARAVGAGRPAAAALSA
jgi:EAL domain-containing protein (putative c-di-GMP-specific phosphodiesterase class I)